MEFLDISSLGLSYRYDVKIEQKFKKKNKQEFGFENMLQHKHGKGNPSSQNKEQRKDNQSNHKQIKVLGR